MESGLGALYTVLDVPGTATHAQPKVVEMETMAETKTKRHNTPKWIRCWSPDFEERARHDTAAIIRIRLEGGMIIDSFEPSESHLTSTLLQRHSVTYTHYYHAGSSILYKYNP